MTGIHTFVKGLTKEIHNVPVYLCKRVIIESPYAGDLERNRKYLNRAIRDCASRGESPYASHMMLTEALDDTDYHERLAGINLGLAWGSVADKIVVYTDYGISGGMKLALDEHSRRYRSIEYRRIGKNVEET